MALVKKIDNEKRVIANKSIIDHSQLTGRDSYGAHPISAIRKLPEKLSALQNKKVDKDQIASEEAPGLVWAYNIGQDNYIWFRDPKQVIVEEIENDQGGITYQIGATTNYQTQENISGGLTYQIGDNE